MPSHSPLLSTADLTPLQGAATFNVIMLEPLPVHCEGFLKNAINVFPYCCSVYKHHNRETNTGSQNKLSMPDGALTLVYLVSGWLHGTVVERWSLIGKLLLSCTRPTTNG